MRENSQPRIMGMITTSVLRCSILSLAALAAPILFTACKGTDISGNATVASDAPGPGVDSTGPTVPGNVVPTIGGGAGNGAGTSGGGAGVGNGH